MSVRSVVKGRSRHLSRRRLSGLARRVLAGEGSALPLQIVLADDRLLRALNERYRGKRRTTDVLSFKIPGVAGLAPEAGEVYISLAQARRQARRYGQPLVLELERLVVHGTLHLLGFDHHRAVEARRMRLREAHYLKPVPRKRA
jgi:probable rRNA maturation factor